MLGFPSVTLYSKDLYALDVLAILLGDGQTSRLYYRLKDKENKVLSVSASNWTPSFVHGQFMISLTLDPQNWPKILDPIEEEINRLKKDLVAPEELEKAKKLVLAQHIFGKETVSALASLSGFVLFRIRGTHTSMKAMWKASARFRAKISVRWLGVIF